MPCKLSFALAHSPFADATLPLCLELGKRHHQFHKKEGGKDSAACISRARTSSAEQVPSRPRRRKTSPKVKTIRCPVNPEHTTPPQHTRIELHITRETAGFTRRKERSPWKAAQAGATAARERARASKRAVGLPPAADPEAVPTRAVPTPRTKSQEKQPDPTGRNGQTAHHHPGSGSSSSLSPHADRVRASPALTIGCDDCALTRRRLPCPFD
jgi:hypothetical protein